MKQLEALIAWTPIRWADLRPETAGQVAVLPFPDTEGRAKGFMMSAGASSSALRTLSEEQRIARPLQVFTGPDVRDFVPISDRG